MSCDGKHTQNGVGACQAGSIHQKFICPQQSCNRGTLECRHHTTPSNREGYGTVSGAPDCPFLFLPISRPSHLSRRRCDPLSVKQLLSDLDSTRQHFHSACRWLPNGSSSPFPSMDIRCGVRWAAGIHAGLNQQGNTDCLQSQQFDRSQPGRRFPRLLSP